MSFDLFSDLNFARKCLVHFRCETFDRRFLMHDFWREIIYNVTEN